MNLKTLLLPLLVAGVFLLPGVSFAADANFFGPIISDGSNGQADCTCPTSAPDWGCVLQTFQNVINLGVSLSVIFFVLVFAYAGVLLLTSPTNPGNRKTAKNMIGASVVGFLIAMSAWLIVDFVMKAVYDEGSFGPWNSILDENSDRTCILEQDAVAGPSQPTTSTSSSNQTGSGPNCPAADPDDMVPFPPEATTGGSYTATPETVSNFMAMRAAALEDGIDLKVFSAYRSDARQLELWNENGCADGTCSRPTATPCSIDPSAGSNHNSGKAVDIAGACSNGVRNCNTPIYRWLNEHGSQWGFRNSLPTDPVHWSPTGR